MTQAAAESRRESIVTIEERGRRQEFGSAELPVTLGAAHDSDMVLDGVAGSIQIGRFKDVFFVQPGRGARNLRIGGEPLTGTRELQDGDVIAFDRARLTCRVAGGKLALKVEWIVTAGDTAPPDLEQAARARSRSSDVAITPIAFKPRSETKVAARRGPSRMTIAISAAAGLLAVVAWFAFTAKSVALDFEPEPASVSLPSTLFKVKVGDRFLLRPGSHRVAAELPGYYPLDTKIDVGSLADQTFALTLTKLPGLVTLATRWAERLK